MSTCKRCGCEFDYDLTRGTGYAPDLCGAFCDGVYSERKVSALKIAGLMTQIDELRDERDALAAEISRLRTLEAAAIHWSTHRCVHGVGRLERAVEEAQKARKQ